MDHTELLKSPLLGLLLREYIRRTEIQFVFIFDVLVDALQTSLLDIFGMVIGEMGQVDHPTGLPILWKCQHQVQNRAMERLMTQNQLRVVLHGKWLKMLIFHEILQEQMLRLIPRLLVQEQGLSHPLIATSEARDELLQEPECVTVISNLSPPKLFFILTHTHPHIFYITPYPFP